MSRILTMRINISYNTCQGFIAPDLTPRKSGSFASNPSALVEPAALIRSIGLHSSLTLQRDRQ